MKFFIYVFLAFTGYACAAPVRVRRSPAPAPVPAPADWNKVTDLSSPPRPVPREIIPRNATEGLVKRDEVVSCYDTGTEVDRLPSATSIDDFCSRHMGVHVENGQEISQRYEWATFTILLSATATNGCSWTVDENCNRLFRRALDECNTDGENGKQGGQVSDVCAIWRFDPGSNGSDY